MSATQTTPISSAAAPMATPVAKPDYYTLHGGSISITYLPTGPGGLARLSYSDPNRAVTFTGNEIRRADVADLGTVVSVTLSLLVDAGSTTFSFLLPAVNLPDHTGASSAIHTEGITTVHRTALFPPLNLGQTETYSIVRMTGTASLVIIPL